MKKQSLSLTACLLLCLGGPTALQAQSKAFSYQGRLTDNGVPANGQYRMRFRLFAELQPEGGQGLAASTQSVSVVNGLFTARPEFIGSPEIFDGDDRWLEIGVAGIDNPDLFTALVPRQNITRTPYALYSATAGGPVDGLPWNFGEQVTFNAASGPPFSILSSAKVTGLNVDLLDGLDSSAFWKLTGNSGTAPGLNFLGTIDAQPLELRVNNLRAGRWLQGANDALGNPTINVLGGSPFNRFDPPEGTTLPGATIAGGHFNTISNAANFATISGGIGNAIGSGAGLSTIAGGFANNIGADAFAATIAGGTGNAIGAEARGATIAGGYGNDIGADAADATIAGGSYNKATGIQASIGGGNGNHAGGGSSTVAGGLDNDATGAYGIIAGGRDNASAGYASTVMGGYGNEATGNWSTVAGGSGNAAVGDHSFAAGRNAKANHVAAFVWADTELANFSSTANNQFLIRAAGGVGIGTASPKQSLHNNGDYYGKGHLWLHAREGDGVSGTAYVQARDDSASSTIALQLRTQSGGSVVDVMRLTPSGRVGIGTTTPTTALQVIGTVTATAFNPPSDRNLKENFSHISPREVLDKVAALTITRWNFKNDSATPHLGPMAQDFHAAFGLGTDDKHISTVDADGVALAAIQGLHQMLKEKEAEIGTLKTRLLKLEQRLAEPVADLPSR